MHLSFKTLTENFKKKLNLIVFGIMMILILVGGLWLTRFLNTVWLKVTSEAAEIASQGERVDYRLYEEVMKRLERDTQVPIRGIEGLNNPFPIITPEETTKQ